MSNLKNNTDFKGLWIPSELILSDLTMCQERLLAIIWALDEIDTAGCRAQNKYLSNVSKIKGVSNVIKQLISLGHLHRTYKYKPNSQEIDTRFLKVISPLLLTEERKNKDRFLVNLFTSNDDPLHAGLRPPSSEMMAPFTEDERDNIIDNKEDNNTLSLKRESDSNFSAPIPVEAISAEAPNPKEGTGAVDVATLIELWKAKSLSSQTFVNTWTKDRSREDLERLATECASHYVMTHFSNTKNEALALKELSRQLDKSLGMRESAALNRWIQREGQFKNKNNSTTHGKKGSNARQFKPGKNHDYEGTYNKYMAMAEEYFGTAAG